MSMFSSKPTTPVVVRTSRPLLDEALAAVAFLARYGGRTLESYRADLRQFFQWCAHVEVAPGAVTRTHIELYRAWMDERGLAPSTVDRRSSTVCGYYRFAHIDRRITSNPARTCADQESTQPSSEAWTAASWRTQPGTNPAAPQR
jgi:site-specific recombinase XerD